MDTGGNILWVKDNGRWSADEVGNGVTARGTFSIDLVWNTSLGTLVGTLTLDGVHSP